MSETIEGEPVVDIGERLKSLATERQALILPYFNEEIGWRIGCEIRKVAARQRLPIAFEVSRTGGRLFYCAMAGSSPDNEAWIHRKRNVVERFGESSLTMALQCEAAGTNVIDRFKLSPADFVHSGGSVAVLVERCGCIGAVTVSGLRQTEDHRLAAEAIATIKAEIV